MISFSGTYSYVLLFFICETPSPPFLLCTMWDRTLANNLLTQIKVSASSRGEWPGHPTSVWSLLGARNISLPHPNENKRSLFYFPYFFPGLKRTLAARKRKEERGSKGFFLPHTRFDRFFPPFRPSQSFTPQPPPHPPPHSLGQEEGRVKWGGSGVNGQMGRAGLIHANHTGEYGK